MANTPVRKISPPVRQPLLLLAVLLVGTLLPALQALAAPSHLQKIDMQLRWHHQFQFAGYYAALEQGYYREAGLDVRIHAGAPGRTPVDEVLSGRAQYGEANSELLYQRLQGEPLVALASIFQHSPSVLLARADSGIRSPQDLVGKRVMVIGDVTDADLHAMFQNEGVDLSRVKLEQSSYNIQDLADGKTDAFNSYLTNEPFFLHQSGIDYNVIDPRRYGIDFYSDILFTTEQELEENPERVRAFREASLRGWHYAMAHPQEIIDLLINKYGVKKTRAHLEYEAKTMRDLIQPELVQIGHMNPGRWEHMADTFVKVGMIKPGYKLDGFLYDTDRSAEVAKLRRIIWLSVSIAVFLSIAVLIYVMQYRRLHQEIRRREAAEEEIRRLAFHDTLTGLPNRNLFYDRFEQVLARAQRDQESFALCFIDLDGFKQVNDRFGHAVGDKLLTAVAQRLQSSIRATDTVARFGGDEFVVLLPTSNSYESAKQLGDKFLECVRQTYRIDDFSLSISASIGITLYPQEEGDLNALLHNADEAMYHGKQNGKDQLVFYREMREAC